MALNDLTDAEKVYAWIQDKQRQGYTIIALTPEDMRVLETHPDLSGRREVLVSMLEPPVRGARAVREEKR